MMRKFKLIGLTGLFVCMFTLSSCSSDNNKDDFKTNIVGLWETTHTSGYTYDDTEERNIISVDKDLTGKDQERILLKGNGTYKEYYYLESSDSWYGSIYDTGNYEVSRNKIYLYDSKGNIEDIYTIISLTGNTAIIEYTLEEGPHYTGRITLKKVE